MACQRRPPSRMGEWAGDAPPRLSEGRLGGCVERRHAIQPPRVTQDANPTANSQRRRSSGGRHASSSRPRPPRCPGAPQEPTLRCTCGRNGLGRGAAATIPSPLNLVPVLPAVLALEAEVEAFMQSSEEQLVFSSDMSSYEVRQ